MLAKIFKLIWKEYKAGVIVCLAITLGFGVYEFFKGEFKIWLWAFSNTVIILIGLIALISIVMDIKDKVDKY